MTETPQLVVRLNDPADDSAFHIWHGIYAAANSHDRGPEAPSWTESEMGTQLRTERNSSKTELYVVDLAEPSSRDSDSAAVPQTAVGAIALTIPLSDNLHRVDVELHVHPDHRRRGIGSAMLEFVRTRSAQLGRRVIATEVFHPYETTQTSAEGGEPTDTVPGLAFAEHHGFAFAIGDLRSECALPLDPAHLDAVADDARPFHADYEIRSWTGDVPAEFIDQWALMEGLVETEAPSGDREIEPEVTTAADIREQEAIFGRQGRSSFAAIALDPSGDIAAYTQLVHSSAETMVYQWGTLVRNEHRGHRLGTAVKAACARELSRSGLDARAIITYNAEENEHMLAINRELGFRPVERIDEVELRLDV